MTSSDGTLLEGPKTLQNTAQSQNSPNLNEGALQQNVSESQQNVQQSKEQSQQQKQQGPKRPFAVYLQIIAKIIVAISAASQIGSFVCMILSDKGTTLQQIVLWYIQIINIVYLLLLIISMIIPVTSSIKLKHQVMLIQNPLVIMFCLAYITLYNISYEQDITFKGDAKEVARNVLFIISLVQIPVLLIYTIVAFCSQSGISNWYLLNKKQVQKPLYL